MVSGSADRLTQVFENLLANAVSFSPPGGEINVHVQNIGDGVEIVVSDDGPGIPEAHRSRIFSRFFSYRPENDDDGHTGLGLAIVKAIVDGYGGRIQLNNRAEGGVECVVNLPHPPG